VQLAADVNTLTSGSSPFGMTTINAGTANEFALFFAESDDVYSLWRTNGTTAGTYRVSPSLEFSMPGLGTPRAFVTPISGGGGGALLYVPETANSTRVWFSDGTAAGTRSLISVNANPYYKFPPTAPASFGGSTYFAARPVSSSDTTLTLHRTDGTAAGTVSLAGVSPNFEGITLQPMTTPFGLAIARGEKLYKSNGTAAGTQLLATLAPTDGAIDYGYAGSIREMFVGQGKLYFAGRTLASGVEPWISDGTVAGTKQWKEIVPGAASSFPKSFFAGPGNRVGFVSYEEATFTESLRFIDADGMTMRTAPLPTTGSTTNRITSIDSINVLPNGRVIYSAYFDGGIIASSRFVTSTTLETVKLGARPGFAPGQPMARLQAAGKVLLPLSDPSNPLNPATFFYTSDGTVAGTQLAMNTGGVSPSWMKALSDVRRPTSVASLHNGIVYVAHQGSDDFEPWFTDGTLAGTRQLADIQLGPTGGSGPRDTLALNGRLLFYALPGPSSLIDVYNQDALSLNPATGLVERLPGFFLPYREINDDRAPLLVKYGSRAIVRATDRFVATDGTAAGTTSFTSLKPLLPDSNFAGYANTFSPGGGFVWMLAKDAAGVSGLYRTDGTPANTSLKFNFTSLTLAPFPDQFLVVANDQFVFIHTGRETWVHRISDGKNTRVWSSLDGRSVSNVAFTANRLIFSRDSGYSTWPMIASDLFATGNAAAGQAQEVRSADNRELDVRWMANVGGKVFATIRGIIYCDIAEELFVTDGTTAGTQIVADINPGEQGSFPRDFTPIGTRLYFNAKTPALGREWYWTDIASPTGAQLLVDSRPGPESGIQRNRVDTAITRIVQHEGLLYFSVDADVPEDLEPPTLWQSDGTPAGSRPVNGGAAIGSLERPANPMYAVAVGRELYFAGTTNQYGSELMRLPRDESAPTVQSAASDLSSPRRSAIRIRWDEAVALSSTSLGAVVVNGDTNVPVSSALFDVEYDATIDSHFLRYRGTASGQLPDGRYRVVVPSGRVRDAAGLQSTAFSSQTLTIRTADFNADGIVNFDDLLLLASHYNTSDALPREGDANFDGAVNFDDLLLLAAKYNQPLQTTPDPAPTFGPLSAPSPGDDKGDDASDSVLA
jgi:ELWxxDGT repeat protein